jgi:hypothetical protein
MYKSLLFTNNSLPSTAYTKYQNYLQKNQQNLNIL